MKRLLPLLALLPAMGLAEPLWVGRFASDTDNTGEEARAGFADFRFVARGGSC